MPNLRFARVAGLCVLLFVGCAKRERGDDPTHQRRPDGSVMLRGPSLDFVLVEPATKPLGVSSRALFARVTYDERKLAVLGPPVTGRVTSVDVVAGAQVKKGDALLTIRSADIAAAQAQVAEARQARLLAQETASRTAMLVRQGAASDAERLQADTALATSKLEEGRVVQSLASLGGTAGSSDYVLRSPLGGTVVDRSVAIGNAVTADQGEALLTVADLSGVWIVADVHEPDLPIIKPGDRAVVRFPALPGRDFDAKVAHVGEVVDATTRAARARIELANADGSLRPGMFAEVVVESKEAAASEVPVAAVLARRDEFYVFVKRADGAFERRKVTLGLQTGEHVTIRAGLAPGEPVVTRGAILLDAEASSLF
jgi:membrane fusion protein, heavy metal efflux system